jgi:hypothetical protein
MDGRRPAGPLDQPHLAETRPSHLTPPRDIAMATEDARLRQSTTDHPLHCHLATNLALDPWINSTSPFCPRPTVRRTPTMPGKRCRAAQSARSVPPFQCDHAPSSPALHAHRHGIEPSMRRHPRPAPRCTKTTPTAHRFTPRRSKNRRAPAEPPSHRHRPPVPWTQHTMPRRTAAHGTQWSPSQVHHGPNPADSIKLGTPSGSLPSLPFAPSPFSLICRTSPPCSRGETIARELKSIW